MTSPVYRLPNELLSEIFLSFVQVERYKLLSLTLSHVCRQWRNMSIGTAALWSSIGIHDHEDPDSTGVQQLTELYLTRSRSHPLDIFIDVRSFVILHALVKHSLRWKSLELKPNKQFNRVWRLKRIIRDIAGKLPLLESFAIEYGFDDDELEDHSLLRFFKYAPQLRILKVKSRNRVARDFDFPSETLNHITIHTLNADDISDLLHSCPNLRKAYFHRVLSGAQPPNGTRKSFSHGTLSVLCISLRVKFCQTTRFSVENLFRDCSFPSLTTFELTAASESICGSIKDIPTFLHSCTTLRHLKLSMIYPVSEERFLGVLRSSPLLETLDLRDVHGYPYMIANLEPTLLAQLTLQEGVREDVLLPCLKSFYLALHPNFVNSRHSPKFDALIRMIASRRERWVPERMSRLETVDIGPHWTKYVYDFPPAFVEGLRKLQADGLCVNVQ